MGLRSPTQSVLGDTVLGEFLGVSTKDVWRLKMVDEPQLEFRGQFIAENLTENVGSFISDEKSLNQGTTNSKWLHSKGDIVTFSTRIFAEHSLKNVKKKIETLKSFCKRSDALKRAPIFMFSAGTEFACKCFVATVGGIKYDRMRSDGSLRGATFSVTLKVIEPSSPATRTSLAGLIKSGLGIISAVAGLSNMLGTINVPGGSLHRKGRKIITKQGQTFEHLSKIEYGDALYGDILRRIFYQNPLNSIKMGLETGDIIDIVEKNDIFSIEVTPQSTPFEDNVTSRTNIDNHLILRSESKIIYV